MGAATVNDDQYYGAHTDEPAIEHIKQMEASPTFTGSVGWIDLAGRWHEAQGTSGYSAFGCLHHRGYTGSVEMCFEHDYLHGIVLGICSLITYRARTPAELLAEFISAVDDYLADCHADGKEPEQPNGE